MAKKGRQHKVSQKQLIQPFQKRKQKWQKIALTQQNKRRQTVHNNIKARPALSADLVSLVKPLAGPSHFP
ncbi:hypothetical protein [Thermaerobacillus caldiproteolyticus]|uniref:hypothetical protein n=1 Tax=Thermaerobacillus caldiproteolyticus TaxID=247480 RepID=UPI0018F141D3|nr:hypothetical protein [Anoxybacillus caldiproteolyticus]